jgi:hypothetical protein
MTTDLSRYIVNPGPKVPVSGLTADEQSRRVIADH